MCIHKTFTMRYGRILLMNKLLVILILIPITVFANPTSGWQDSDGGGLLAILATLAIFIVPYVISRIINLFKPRSNLNDNIRSGTENEISEEATDKDEKEEPSHDQYANVYKRNAKELAKGMYIKEDNNPNTKINQPSTGSRDLIYILIILGLCVLMYYQYSQYRLDSYSRTTQCFTDVVPDSDVEFCNSFFEKQNERIIREDSVEIILGCWDENFSMCSTEDITYEECAKLGIAYCDAKHPEYMEFFEEEYEKSQKEL